MIIKCIANDISFLASNNARERVRWWTDSHGRYNDLEIGNHYQVQAVEYFKDGLFYYLHTIETGEHPYPYASEFFVIEDSLFPREWVVSFQTDNGQNKLKRITFPKWAKDDHFFEKLVDGESEYVSEYLRNRIDLHGHPTIP